MSVARRMTRRRKNNEKGKTNSANKKKHQITMLKLLAPAAEPAAAPAATPAAAPLQYPAQQSLCPPSIDAPGFMQQMQMLMAQHGQQQQQQFQLQPQQRMALPTVQYFQPQPQQQQQQQHDSDPERNLGEALALSTPHGFCSKCKSPFAEASPRFCSRCGAAR